MAEVCRVGNAAQPSPALDASMGKVGLLLSDEKLLGAALLAEVRKPENWDRQAKSYNYVSMAYVNSFKQYLAGACGISYSEMKELVQRWNKSSLHNDPVSVAVRDNLLQILSGVSDPEMKDKAQTLLGILRTNTPDIALAPAAPPKPVVTLADAAPGAPRVPVATNADTFTGKGKSAEEMLSDESIFGKQKPQWDAAKYGPRLYVVKMAIATLRSYVGGKATEAELKQKMQLWAKHEALGDPLSKAALLGLQFQLSMAATLNEGLDPKVKARMEKAAKLLPETPEEKKADKEPPAKPDAAKPAPAGNAELAKALEALSDAAIFGAPVSAADKYGPQYSLHKMVEHIRAYIRGDKEATYASVKQKVEAWSKSEGYKEGASQKARTQLLSILGAQSASVSEAGLKGRLSAVLMFIQRTPAVEAPPAAPVRVEAPKPAEVKPADAPADPVKTSYAFNVGGMPAPAGDAIPAEKLPAELERLAKAAGAAYNKQLGGDFSLKALPTLTFDDKGYLVQVRFDQVSAESNIKTGAQMQEALSTIAAHWRNIRFMAKQPVPLGRNPSSFTGH